MNQVAHGLPDEIYGLKFASYEVKKDLRTSLDLTPFMPLEVNKSFQLSFDFRYYRSNSAYGYIFRLITDQSDNFDLLSKTSSLQENDIEFVSGSDNTNIHYNLNEIIRDTIGDWIHTLVYFDLENKTISLHLNGVVKSDTLDMKEIRNVRIVFGASNYNRYSTADVPPIILKDIRFESNGKNKRQWKLNQYNNLEISDNIGGSKAEVLNPVWIIDKHSKWTLEHRFITHEYPKISFNSLDSKMYIVEDEQIQIVNFLNDSISIIKYKSGRPLMSHSNQLIYNFLNDELWQYNINNPEIAKYNFNANAWDNFEKLNLEPAYWHHNKFFRPVDSSLMIFGGYGFYRYKNQFLKFLEESQSWEEVAVNGFIKPRYLSALGYGTKSDEILIFGGYGNESGKQELSPECLYDLFSLDLNSYKLTKLWELNNNDINFAQSNSLISDSANGCFYTLCYPVHKYNTQLYLVRFGISEPDMEIMSDTLSYLFQDTESYCDLFYSNLTKELIAVTSSYIDNNQSEVSVYSLLYPPVGQGGTYYEKSSSEFSALLKIFIYVITIITIGAIVFFILRKLKIFKPSVKRSLIQLSESLIPEKINISTKISLQNSYETEKEIISETNRKCSVQLLGGFQVIDKNNKDIGGLFTPTLRQVFIMILLYSLDEGKGVSSDMLKDSIWFRKSKESARNIRGVYILKLRMLLQKIGDVKLLNTNNCWTIYVGSDIDYDFGRISQLLKITRENPEIIQNYFSELIKLCLKGPLLPNIEYDWIDRHKDRYSNEVIDVLLDYSKKLDLQQDIKKIIQISDAVFINDPLNEDALQLKCKVLNNSGKHSLAMKVFENYVREYKNSMGIAFNRTFNDITT